MRIDRGTRILFGKTIFAETKPVQLAVQVLRRDMRKRFEHSGKRMKEECRNSLAQEADCGRIILEDAASAEVPCGRHKRKMWSVESQPEENRKGQEQFRLEAKGGNLYLYASDELGFVYGLYEISRTWLGITDFWFWNDQEIVPVDSIEIPDGYVLESEPYAVRCRGWFVNDEVLLHTWCVDGSKEKPWEMVFETLLRLGGNMVIPGTDKNSKIYRKLASDMGLIVTHHHAEPLGAEMFARTYPELNPSYAEHPEKFQYLWKQAIEEQRGQKTIWNLGFRGQGDCPFWENDPAYQTDEARGELMSQLIRRQYDLVKAEDPQAVCCTNLYGETMELYRKGCLSLPEDLIKVWADNGYGKMVSRRQGNYNPRIDSLAEEAGTHGIYYHVSFYDLQAASHITMLPNSPEFVQKELTGVLQRGMNDFWIINCSNVKPHVYLLDFIAKLWRDGAADAAQHRAEYVRRYYGQTALNQIVQRLREYPQCAVQYGPHEDEHAGEQFFNYVTRILLTQCMKDRSRSAEELFWAVQSDSLNEQVQWYARMSQDGLRKYGIYVKNCEDTMEMLDAHGAQLFRDSILLQAQIYAQCCKGADYACCSMQKFLEGAYKEAFYYAGKARQDYLAADAAMRACEHDKWKNFYANECLTDLKQTAWVLQGFMAYARALGDGPHYYQWQREFLYSKTDRRVVLITNMENHLQDEELFQAMECREEQR